MRTVMIYTLLALLGLNFQSCRGKNKSESKRGEKDMTDCYVWGPGACAPLLFPAELRYAYFMFGEGKQYPVVYSMIGGGIGTGSSNASLNDLDGKMLLPYGFSTLWFSYADRKIYGADIFFSDELKSRILELFRTGYVSTVTTDEGVLHEKSNYMTYSLTMLPGGRVFLHLTGIGRSVYLASFQCQEKNVTLEELHLPYVTYAKNVKEFFDDALKFVDFASMLAYIKKHGIPTELWDRYLERFCYEIKIEFEDEQTVIDPNYGYDFSNGETFFSDDSVKVDSLARIKNIVFAWNVADTVYTGYFYFNEDEVLEYFDKAYGKNRNQKGEFVIKVGKYNNCFDICLKVSEKESKFEKTQIHVFKQGVNQPDRDAVVYYDNYQGEDPTKFIGE